MEQCVSDLVADLKYGINMWVWPAVLRFRYFPILVEKSWFCLPIKAARVIANLTANLKQTFVFFLSSVEHKSPEASKETQKNDQVS